LFLHLSLTLFTLCRLFLVLLLPLRLLSLLYKNIFVLLSLLSPTPGDRKSVWVKDRISRIRVRIRVRARVKVGRGFINCTRRTFIRVRFRVVIFNVRITIRIRKVRAGIRFRVRVRIRGRVIKLWEIFYGIRIIILSLRVRARVGVRVRVRVRIRKIRGNRR
jgi:hypothetical protein